MEGIICETEKFSTHPPPLELYNTNTNGTFAPILDVTVQVI